MSISAANRHELDKVSHDPDPNPTMTLQRGHQPAAVGPLGSGAPPAARRNFATCAHAFSMLSNSVVVSKSLLRFRGTSHSAVPV